MANKTSNYGLTKPLQEEFYDVGVQNNNMDIIDTELKRVDDKVKEVDTSLKTVSPHVKKKDNPHGVTAEQVGLVPLAELPNLYVWRKYTDNSSYVESEVGRQTICITTNVNLSYASEISVSSGVISLVNPETYNSIISSASLNSVRVILGNFVKNNVDGKIYYVYPSSSLGIEDTQYTDYLYASEASMITVSERTPLGLVASKEIGAYPNNGKHTDGYWYEYQSKFGENPYPYTYGTEDMIASESALETGKLYFVYE